MTKKFNFIFILSFFLGMTFFIIGSKTSETIWNHLFCISVVFPFIYGGIECFRKGFIPVDSGEKIYKNQSPIEFYVFIAIIIILPLYVLFELLSN